MLERTAMAATATLVAPWIRRTPVLRLDRSDFGRPPGPLVLKLEQTQVAGSFKPRGAFSNALRRPVGAAGIVAASGGNHGAAVAFVGRALGVPATVFVPTVSSAAKVDRIRSYGAELVITGANYSEAAEAMLEWAAGRDVLEIPAYDREETMLGTATLGLELQEQVPGADLVLTAVGGGGLLAGVSASYAGTATRVIGVEPEGAPTLTEARRAGHPVDAPTGSVAVDALAPRQIGALTFPVIQQHVDDVALVDDDDIRAAQHQLWDVARLLVEPSGCAALAAVLNGRVEAGPDQTVVVVLSGANTVLHLI